MCELKKNYPKKEEAWNASYAIKKKEDATGHVATKLECQTVETDTFIKYKIQNTSNQWAEVASKAQLYRENKELRK